MKKNEEEKGSEEREMDEGVRRVGAKIRLEVLQPLPWGWNCVTCKLDERERSSSMPQGTLDRLSSCCSSRMVTWRSKERLGGGWGVEGMVVRTV